MSFLPYPPATTSAAIEVFRQDVALTHEVVHGTDTSDVLTENGLIPSLSKTIKSLTDRADQIDDLKNQAIVDINADVAAVESSKVVADMSINSKVAAVEASKAQALIDISAIQDAVDQAALEIASDLNTVELAKNQALSDMSADVAKAGEFITSTNTTFVDTVGNTRLTIEGVIQAGFDGAATVGIQFKDPATFTTGATLNNNFEALRRESDGEYFRWTGTVPKVVAAGTNPLSDSRYVAVGSGSLAAKLAAAGSTQAVAGVEARLLTVAVDSVKTLATITSPNSNTVYHVRGLTSGGFIGGGTFIYRSTVDKATHDGSSIIAPEAINLWDGTVTNIATLINWTGTGTGAWLLLSSNMSPSALSMEGRSTLGELPETNFYITNNTGVTDLPAGWPQGRYFVKQVGRPKDVYCHQEIIDVSASGANGGSVCRRAERRMRAVGSWSDWFEIPNTNSAIFRELTPAVNNVTTLSARVGLFDNQVVHVGEYNAGTDVGGGSFVWNSTSTATANGVTIFGAGASGRWIRQWSVLTPEMAGCVGDNSTNNHTAISRLIAFAKIDDTVINWERKTYLCTSANIADFHAVRHEGNGVISKAGTLWYITPRGTQENILYVTSAGTATNDGMTSGTPVTISRARDILKAIGSKSSDGIWRIQISGTITFDGIRFDDWPLFRNKLRVWGDDVALTATPTTIWNGATASAAFALRQDIGPAAVANWHFKNIKFINWMVGGGNSGAILVWAQGSVLTENIHCDNMRIGMWFRHNLCRATHGRITNVDTYGIGVQYGASGNIGDLSGGGVYVRGRAGNAAIGIAVGRNTTCYIQGCDIDSTKTHINVTRVSRIRTQSNIFGANYTVCCVWNDTNSVWTPANDEGATADIYPALTEEKPAYRAEIGAVHQLIDRGSPRSVHNVSSGAILAFTNTTTTLLGSLDFTFTPFRLPAWFWYSPTSRLDIELGISLTSGAGGTLAFHGGGSSAATKLAEITIPAVTSGTKGQIRISVTQRSGVSTAHYSVEFKAAGILSEYNNTPSLNNAAIRTNNELDIDYRLYWTSLNTNQVEIFNMRTYVES